MFTKAGPKVALLGPAQNREPPMKGGVHLRTAAVVEHAAGKRATSAGWLVSASDVGAEGSETPRLQAAGKVPTVAALGSRAPRGAATKHTEQSTHQAAIWAALVYAGQCLAKGRRVTLTVESVTALRNCTPRPRARAHHRRKPPAEERGRSRHRDKGRRDRQRATGTSGRGPTRGPTSRGGGTETAARAQEAPRLPVRH